MSVLTKEVVKVSRQLTITRVFDSSPPDQTYGAIRQPTSASATSGSSEPDLKSALLP